MVVTAKRFIEKKKSCSCSMPGVWRAVHNCYGIVVIFHSPLACTHVSRSLDLGSYYRIMSSTKNKKFRTIPLVCSRLEEKHTIFGGAERLAKCIEEVVKEYKPKCIVIANSCVAGVIGDDVDSVAMDAEQKWNVPIVSVGTYGFLNGEYNGGYFEVANKIVDRFFKLQPKIKKTALLLGDNDGPNGDYAIEITRLLARLEVKVIGQFPGYTSFSDFAKITQAQSIIILGNRGQTCLELEKLAKKMQKHFAFTYVPGVYPLGWKQTKKWIVSMGYLFSCHEKAAELLAEEEAAINDLLEKIIHKVEGKKVLLCIGRWLIYFKPDFILEIIKMMKLKLVGIVILSGDSRKMREEMINAIYKIVPEAEIYDAKNCDYLLKSVDLIITTHELCCNNRQIFIPMLPKAGKKGVIDMMTEIYRSLCSKKEHGGISYV